MFYNLFMMSLRLNTLCMAYKNVKCNLILVRKPDDHEIGNKYDKDIITTAIAEPEENKTRPGWPLSFN